MIQDNDDIVVGKITLHVDKLRKDIELLADSTVKQIYGKCAFGNSVHEVIIMDYFLDADPITESTNSSYVIVRIPSDVRMSTRFGVYYYKKRICDMLYMRMLNKIVKDYPVEEHDLHNCNIRKVSLLDDWFRYEAQL